MVAPIFSSLVWRYAVWYTPIHEQAWRGIHHRLTWLRMASHVGGALAPAPTYVNCRHEILAVGAAAGYHRATGKLPAVTLHTTSGSCATNLRGALHNNTPMRDTVDSPLLGTEEANR